MADVVHALPRMRSLSFRVNVGSRDSSSPSSALFRRFRSQGGLLNVIGEFEDRQVHRNDQTTEQNP